MGGWLVLRVGRSERWMMVEKKKIDKHRAGALEDR